MSRKSSGVVRFLLSCNLLFCLPSVTHAEPAAPTTAPATTAPTTAPAATSDAEQLFRTASPAVVRVEVQDEKMAPIGLGSGFFISDDGLLVTNFHVIRGASFASVRRADGSTLFVEGIVASDPQIDLAVLKIKGQKLPTL